MPLTYYGTTHLDQSQILVKHQQGACCVVTAGPLETEVAQGGLQGTRPASKQHIVIPFFSSLQAQFRTVQLTQRLKALRATSFGNPHLPGHGRLLNQLVSPLNKHLARQPIVPKGWAPKTQSRIRIDIHACNKLEHVLCRGPTFPGNPHKLLCRGKTPQTACWKIDGHQAKCKPPISLAIYH